MTSTRALVPLCLLFTAGFAGLAAQSPRPANVPIHTWVREDIFAGFLANDLERFGRGEAKVREYVAETPARPEALGWLVAVKLHRAGLAFGAGKTAEGEALVNEALQAADTAVTNGPDNFGMHATIGGSIVTLANKLPDWYYRPLMERARTHYATLYKVQSPALSKLPLHIKGELLAGVAETEFRVGDKAKATDTLNQILKELPETGYATNAQQWLSAPENVTKDTKLVCQSCHEPGRLAAWQARQKQ